MVELQMWWSQKPNLKLFQAKLYFSEKYDTLADV